MNKATFREIGGNIRHFSIYRRSSFSSLHCVLLAILFLNIFFQHAFMISFIPIFHSYRISSAMLFQRSGIRW